jgi:hypothetical protein
LNRAGLLEGIAKASAEANSDDTTLRLHFIDLDGFKGSMMPGDTQSATSSLLPSPAV